MRFQANILIDKSKIDLKGLVFSLKTRLIEFFFSEMKSKEKNLNLRIEKKWEAQKKIVLHERGVWKERKQENKLVISFKINKYEDSMHRRYLLKVYKDAANKEYLNLKTYRERRKSMKFRANSKSNENS